MMPCCLDPHVAHNVYKGCLGDICNTSASHVPLNGKHKQALCVQASRVKFVFDDDSLEVVLGKTNAETENAFVGGENKWKFSTFTNWEFWWPSFPVLVYFKVTDLSRLVTPKP